MKMSISKYNYWHQT